MHAFYHSVPSAVLYAFFRAVVQSDHYQLLDASFFVAFLVFRCYIHCSIYWVASYILPLPLLNLLMNSCCKGLGICATCLIVAPVWLFWMCRFPTRAHLNMKVLVFLMSLRKWGSKKRPTSSNRFSEWVMGSTNTSESRDFTICGMYVWLRWVTFSTCLSQVCPEYVFTSQWYVTNPLSNSERRHWKLRDWRDARRQNHEDVTWWQNRNYIFHKWRLALQKSRICQTTCCPPYPTPRSNPREACWVVILLEERQSAKESGGPGSPRFKRRGNLGLPKRQKEGKSW